MKITSKDLVKIIVSSILLSFSAWFSLAFKFFEASDLTISYPFYDKSTWGFSLNPVELYKDPVKWWIKEQSDKTIPIIIFIVWAVIKPNFKHGIKFSLKWMWFAYILMIYISHTLSYEKFPPFHIIIVTDLFPFAYEAINIGVRNGVDCLVVACQLVYVSHCAHIMSRND